MAFLQGVPPSALCMVPEGGGIKVRGAEAFGEHRDEHDSGRLQCVMALSDLGFEVRPKSHLLPRKKGDVVGDGHFHFCKEFVADLQANCDHVIFSAKPGDVFIFVGAWTVHGVPEVGPAHPSPRVVTYASFWPPGTPKHALHEKKLCACYKQAAAKPLAALAGPA